MGSSWSRKYCSAWRFFFMSPLPRFSWHHLNQSGAFAQEQVHQLCSWGEEVQKVMDGTFVREMQLLRSLLPAVPESKSLNTPFLEPLKCVDRAHEWNPQFFLYPYFRWQYFFQSSIGYRVFRSLVSFFGLQQWCLQEVTDLPAHLQQFHIRFNQL